MIIRETTQTFIFIEQHEHATLSGQLAEHWKDDFFWKSAYPEDTLLAIYQHDRGWIRLDNSPESDEVHKKPYSFLNYPLEQKLVHYKLGVDEVEAMNPYAAILCGMHYVSFMRNSNCLEETFIEQERVRQNRLKELLQIHTAEKEALLNYHFHLLQFFDDLSLYLCLNQPGVSKEEEYFFFRNGFKNTDFFALTGAKKIDATWKSQDKIQVSPFPLKTEVEALIPYREISKKEIERLGLKKAYNHAPIQKYKVIITR
jgi:hypothetical protein